MIPVKASFGSSYLTTMHIVYSVYVYATCLHLTPQGEISQLNFLTVSKARSSSFIVMVECSSVVHDFNARIGSLPDVTEESSLLPPRHVIDNTINSQGKALIEFIQACNLCVLNGRFPDGNQYTSVSSKGLAVVDYCIVPIEEMADHYNFTITSMPEAVESLSLQVDAVLSDHSILSWNTPIVPCVSPQDSSTVTSKVIRKIPDHFMESLACKSTLDSLQDALLNHSTTELGVVYDKFCSIIFDELTVKRLGLGGNVLNHGGHRNSLY